MQMTRHIDVAGSHNIRDLGGYVLAGGGQVPWRRFLRSDSLHRIGPEGAERLHDEGLRAVIDLRTPQELETAPNPFATFPGVHFANLPMFDDLSPEALSRQEADGAHPLLSFYRTALEQRSDAIRSILSEMAQVKEGAVLFNCTAGKDRTGVLAAILLGIAGVERKEIVADYAMTAQMIPDLVEEFLAISRARGGNVESYARLLESPAPTMAATLDHITEQHGSVEAYLTTIGLPRSDMIALRVRLTQA